MWRDKGMHGSVYGGNGGKGRRKREEGRGKDGQLGLKVWPGAPMTLRCMALAMSLAGASGCGPPRSSIVTNSELSRTRRRKWPSSPAHNQSATSRSHSLVCVVEKFLGWPWRVNARGTCALYLIGDAAGRLSTEHGTLFQRSRCWLDRGAEKLVPLSQVCPPRNLTL